MLEVQQLVANSKSFIQNPLTTVIRSRTACSSGSSFRRPSALGNRTRHSACSFTPSSCYTLFLQAFNSHCSNNHLRLQSVKYRPILARPSCVVSSVACTDVPEDHFTFSLLGCWQLRATLSFGRLPLISLCQRQLC